MAAKEFPEEHWFLENIPSGFSCLGNVLEIDNDCLYGDYSSMRVVIELEKFEVLEEIWLAGVDGTNGEGSVIKLTPIRIWERWERFDNMGRYIPFFN
jgi:hypothetical protein